MSDSTVLLVDDCAEDCELTLRAFEEIGFRHGIVTARDGQEALDYLFGGGKHAGRDPKAAPALVILDLKMPRVGGFEVLRRMRADPWLKYLVVIIMTSSDEERDRVEAQKLGVNFYFNKPANFDGYIGLARKIAELLPESKR